MNAQDLHRIQQAWETELISVRGKADQLPSGHYEFIRRLVDPFDRKSGEDYIAMFVKDYKEAQKIDAGLVQSLEQYEMGLRESVDDFIAAGVRLESDIVKLVFKDERHYYIEIETHLSGKKLDKIVSSEKFLRYGEVGASWEPGGFAIGVYDLSSISPDKITDRVFFTQRVYPNLKLFSDWLANYPRWFVSILGPDFKLQNLPISGKDDNGYLVVGFPNNSNDKKKENSVVVKLDPERGFCPLNVQLEGDDGAGRLVKINRKASNIHEILPGIWRPFDITLSSALPTVDGKVFSEVVELQITKCEISEIGEEQIIPSLKGIHLIFDRRAGREVSQAFHLQNPNQTVIVKNFLRPLSVEEKAQMERQAAASHLAQNKPLTFGQPSEHFSTFWWMGTAVLVCIALFFVVKRKRNRTG